MKESLKKHIYRAKKIIQKKKETRKCMCVADMRGGPQAKQSEAFFYFLGDKKPTSGAQQKNESTPNMQKLKKK